MSIAWARGLILANLALIESLSKVETLSSMCRFCNNDVIDLGLQIAPWCSPILHRSLQAIMGKEIDRSILTYQDHAQNVAVKVKAFSPSLSNNIMQGLQRSMLADMEVFLELSKISKFSPYLDNSRGDRRFHSLEASSRRLKVIHEFRRGTCGEFRGE